LSPKVPGVVLAVPRCGIDVNRTSFTTLLGTHQLAPCVAARNFPSPAQIQGVLDRLLDVLIGMPWAIHPPNISCLLTLVNKTFDRRTLGRTPPPADEFGVILGRIDAAGGVLRDADHDGVAPL